MKNEEFCLQLKHLSSNHSFDWHFWGKRVVWGLKRSQECGGDREWCSAVAHVAAHLCSSTHLSGEVTSCQLAALYSDSSSSTCLVRIKNAQPPPCTAKEAAPGAWQLWGTSAHSCVGPLLAPRSEGRSDRKSFWQPFAVLVVWCFCLRQLKRALQRGRAQVCEQGLSLEDNPAHRGCEKALHKPVSERVWEIQASLLLRWDLDNINHGSEKSSGINYVGFFFFFVKWERPQ